MNIINFKDKRFKVIRAMVEDEDVAHNIDLWKEYLIAEVVLKKDNKLFFCEEIKDAEIVKDNE